VRALRAKGKLHGTTAGFAKYEPGSVPASAPVKAAAAKQKNDQHNDEKRGGIHFESSFGKNVHDAAVSSREFLPE